MSTGFMAEYFRKLLNELDTIAKTDKPDLSDLMTKKKDDSADTTNKNQEKHEDLDDLLKKDRPADIKKDSVKDVLSLITYLDQFSDLAEYRHFNAAYDDAYYTNVPLELLTDITGLTKADLERIDADTKLYAGSVWIHSGKFDLFGKH